MLTSSISDEALQICTSEINDKDIGRSDQTARFTNTPSLGDSFERLVASQRDSHSLYGYSRRDGYGETVDQCCLKDELEGIEYERAFKHSIENPEEFWAEIGNELTWFKPWDKVLDNTKPPFTKWFVGGMLNACYNAVDRHVENGFGNRLALIHDSPVTSAIHYITYSQLLDKVSRLAGVYSSIGVKKGHRVLIYMPMIPEAIISMLAAARLGAIHSVVFGGFAARELQTRIEHAEPTVIVAASCGVEPNKIVQYRSILQEALSQSSFKPTHVIMYERPEIPLDIGKDGKSPFEERIVELNWEEALKFAIPHDCVPVEANEPLYILYTSGTTDKPKGVVRPVGGHLATLSWTMHAVYGMKNSEQDQTEMCNGKTSDNLVNHHLKDNMSLPKRKNNELNLEFKDQHLKSINVPSINKAAIKSKIPIKICDSQSESGTLENPSVLKENIRDFKSNVEPNCCVHSIEKEERNYYLSKVNDNGDHEFNSSFLDDKNSKCNSDNVLFKLCLKVHQSLTSNRANKTNETVCCNHTSSIDSLHGLKSKEKSNIPSINSTINSLSCDVSPKPPLQNEKIQNMSGSNSSDGAYKLSELAIKSSKSSIFPTIQQSNLTRNTDRKPSKFSPAKIDSNQNENPISHTPCIPNHLSNHIKSSTKSIDCNVNIGIAHEQGISHEHNTKIKSKSLLQIKNNSGQFFGCRNKNKHHILSNNMLKNSNKVWWAASDMGWVVGHSYVCYAPLTAGITSVMYEGKPDRTPDTGQYFRVIEQHGVNALLTAPTALRVIKRFDPNAIYGEKYSTDSLKTIFVAGESLDQSTKEWTERTFKVGVVNHWWQTETGHSITATCLGLGHSPIHPPGLSTGKPFPGFNLCILRDDGSEAAIGEEGRIAARLPLPPGTLSSLYKDPQMFTSLYFSNFPGYYDTMDAGYIIPDSQSSIGWVVVTGREDDVVSVAGHRLSASAIEAVALRHPNVSDALVVGTPDATKGEVPLCLYVPTPGWKKDGEENNDAAQRVSCDLVHMVRELLGPIAAFRLAFPVPALPKTRSGKIPRKSIARMARGLPLKIPSTVEDPLVYEDIKNVLQNITFSKIKCT